MVIDFYIYNIHEVIVWETIWRALVSEGVDAAFVIEPPGINTAYGSMPVKENGYSNQRNQNIVPLVDNDTFHGIVAYLQKNNLSYITNGRYNADAVVTTQGIGWLHRYNSLKLRTMYGVAATRESYGHGNVNLGLDSVFVHGPYSKSKIAHWLPPENIFLSGFPKYSPYFRNEFDTEECKTQIGIHTNRKTIAYIPTWANNSSIDVTTPSLIKLSEKYNVICKPHHNTIRFEYERIDTLMKTSYIKVLQGIKSIVPFIAVSDLVITDVRSGAFTEAFLLDRPVVGMAMDIEDGEILPEVLSAAKLCRHPDALCDIVDETLRNDKYVSGRSVMRNMLFTDLNGNDDIITARYIMEFINRQSVEVYTYQKYVNNAEESALYSGKERLEKAEEYITLMKFEEAKKILNSILEEEPKNVNALNDIAVIDIQEGNYTGAAERLGAILSIDSENEVALENLQFLKVMKKYGQEKVKSNAWEIIKDIRKTNKAIDYDGKGRELKLPTKKGPISGIDSKAGALLYKLAKKIKPAQSIEIGFAYGLSALYILQALYDNEYGSHITIDPFELSFWNGVGLKSVERAGLSHLHRHHELPSHLVLPKLVEEGHKVQFAFIDGSHLFDQVLLDWYYVDKMLAINGVVIFDDWWLPAVKSCTNFIESNLEYNVLKYSTKRLRILQKTGPDTRSWGDHFIPFVVAEIKNE